MAARWPEAGRLLHVVSEDHRGAALVTRFIAAVFAALVLAGCSGLSIPASVARSTGAPDTSHQAQVARFVKLARTTDPTLVGSAASIIHIGHLICGTFADGGGYGVAAEGLRQGGEGESPFQAYVIIALAVTVFCPEYHDQVPPQSPPP